MSLTEPAIDLPDGRRAPRDPAPHRLLGSALIVGAVAEIGIRGGPANAAVATAIGLTLLSLLADHRLMRPGARVLAALSVVPALFLVVRASPWSAWSNVMLSGTLVVVAVLHARHGSILDVTPAQLGGRAVSGLGRGLRYLVIIGSVAPWMSIGRHGRAAQLLRGVLVTGPVLVVLVALLASADVVFASLLTPDIDASPVLGHVALTALFASLVVVMAGATSAADGAPARQGRFGVVELSTILGLVAAVLALFVVSQLVASTDAGTGLIESAGLTPAEYARSGFFQLCWATGVLLGFLGVVRSLADRTVLGHRVVVVLGAAVPALGLGLVVVSLRRMALYDDAFGLTMLRLSVVGASVWMGVVLVMTAFRNLGVGSDRNWLVAGSGAAALALVVVANVADAEGFVARHNLERARTGAELDIGYLATMSDDVVPAIADAIDAETDLGRRGQLRRALGCGHDAQGVAALNLAAQRAASLRDRHCE